MKKAALKSVPLMLLMLSVCLTSAAAAPESRKLQAIFEGEVLKPVKLYSFSRDDYFSLRDVAKVYGSRLSYQPVSGKVALFMNNRRLDIFIKSTKILLDNKKKRLSLPTRYVSGELYVPAAFVLSGDFADFSQTTSSLNRDAGILTVERKVNVVAPRFYSRSNSTQIIIGLAEGMTYDWTQKKQDTILVSFPRGRLNEDSIKVNDGAVKEIVLENDGRQALVRIALAPGAGKVERKQLAGPSRLVITVERTVPPSGEAVAEPVAALDPGVGLSTEAFNSAGVPVPLDGVAEASAAGGAVAVASAPAAPAPAALPRAPRRKKLVVLDAGHGGEDPGAVGPDGTREKEINLDIVYELKRLFEEDGDYDVFLTRTDDTFIPLVERTSLANEKKADLFVSVHCNANDSRDVSGFEIYFLSEKASDPEAAATAFLENSVVRFEGQPNKKRARLQELLWSMAVNEFINESSELCSFITGEVTRRIRIENRGVKQAGFFVLRGAQMPAVLVESAFLSNYSEEAKLKSRRFRQYIADAIYEGVRKFDLRKESVNVRR